MSFLSMDTNYDNVLNDVFKDVSGYLLESVLDRTGLVKNGPTPTGNLSEQQIDKGVLPGVAQISPANNNGVLNSLGFGVGGAGMEQNKMLLMVGAGLFGVVLLALVLKR